jgi:hypothetical protein
MSGTARATTPRASLCTEAKAAGIGWRDLGYPLGQAAVDRYTSSGFCQDPRSRDTGVLECGPEQTELRWTVAYLDDTSTSGGDRARC